MSLENVKAGTVVVKALSGGGFTSHMLVEIEAVNDKGIFIEGCDEDFSDDSVYGYKTNGQPLSSFTPGFKSTLVRIATPEDLVEFAEEEE